MIFLLNITTVFAGNDLESPGINESITESLLRNLAPVTPKEASFDEELTGMDNNFSIGSFAPVTPGTATFDDTIPSEMSMQEIIKLLAPKSPKEVEFNDPVVSYDNLNQFKPVIPHEASFEDIK